MQVKIDENLPASVADVFRGHGHDADTVAQEGLGGRDDAVVWSAAQTAGRFLVTQDIGFADARALRAGPHHGLLLLRLGRPGREALLQQVAILLETENLESWHGCLVIASERKVRVIGPARGGSGAIERSETEP